MQLGSAVQFKDEKGKYDFLKLLLFQEVDCFKSTKSSLLVSHYRCFHIIWLVAMQWINGL